MSLFGGITDWLTGGENQQAEQALNDALTTYSNISVPTQQQLSLPQLQQYVNAGLMTPAQMQAYLQNSNAYALENVPQTGTAAMQQALGQLSSIADAGPMGTPVEQAQIAQNEQQMNNAVQGQRGAIEQQMEAKGTPAAMIQAAMANQYVGQDAQQAYQNSLNAQAAAYQAAVQAMSEQANVGSALQGMQNTQANTVAQAQNAMQQFNAANQQNAAAANANLQQQANQYNTQNAQNVANQNTGMQNARTAYNTAQAQTAFGDAMQKAQGMADIYAKQAGNYQNMGQQAAGTAASIFGGLSNLGQGMASSNALAGITGMGGMGALGGGAGGAGIAGGAMGAGGAGAAEAAPEAAMLLAKGGIVPPTHEYCYHDGGICMEGGGMVPGRPKVPGNSLKNDTVHVVASPGEAVIPRTAVQAHLPEVMGLIAHGQGMPHGMGHGLPPPGAAPAHPHDVATVLQALKEIRMGAPNAI